MFDPIRNEILSFGGFDYPDGNTKVFDTTWVYKSGSWVELHPLHVPHARTRANLVFDESHGVDVMYGGRDVPARDASGSGGEVGGVLYSDDTWIWNGSDWVEQHPVHVPNLFVPDAAYDVETRTVVLVGFTGRMETWSWNGSDWTHQVTADGTPTPIAIQARMSYDPATHSLLRLGGRNDGGGTLNNPWGWNGRVWTRLVATVPVQVYYFGPTAPDHDSGSLLIWNNSYPPSSITSWRWDGKTFSLLCGACTPTLYVTAMAWDPAIASTIVFGRSADGTFETWRWNGATWIQFDGP